jgi:hypothetical protein
VRLVRAHGRFGADPRMGMTARPHLAARQGEGERRRGPAGPLVGCEAETARWATGKSITGLRTSETSWARSKENSAGLQGGFGPKEEKVKEGKKFFC